MIYRFYSSPVTLQVISGRRGWEIPAVCSTSRSSLICSHFILRLPQHFRCPGMARPIQPKQPIHTSSGSLWFFFAFWRGWEIEILMGFGWIQRWSNDDRMVIEWWFRWFKGLFNGKTTSKTTEKLGLQPGAMRSIDVVLIPVIHRTWDLYHRYKTHSKDLWYFNHIKWCFGNKVMIDMIHAILLISSYMWSTLR